MQNPFDFIRGVARKAGFRGIAMGVLAIMALMLCGFPARSATPQTKVTKAPEATAGPPQKTYGSKTAPITLEVFSDFQCPSCRAFYEQTLRPMIGDYVASGKVYIIHRDFPLTIHRYGYQAARWANAAARIGKFAEVESALYDNQDAWAANGDIEKYVGGAMSASDLKRVEKLMEGCADQTGQAAKPASQTTQKCPQDPYIEMDRSLGLEVPVQATPTFVIYYKGKKYSAASGVVSWTILKQFFDQLLTQQG